MRRPTKSIGEKLVGEKISVLRREGVPQRQAVAEALSMQRAGRLRPGGVYVHVAKSIGKRLQKKGGK